MGASPELLVKEEVGRIITHPIAGTVKRGKTLREDEALADELRNSVKDRAEHVSSNYAFAAGAAYSGIKGHAG